MIRQQRQAAILNQQQTRFEGPRYGAGVSVPPPVNPTIVPRRPEEHWRQSGYWPSPDLPARSNQVQGGSAQQGMLGQKLGPLALNIGLGILANNVPRPYTQGPPSLGAGIASGVQQHLAYQQAQQEKKKEGWDYYPALSSDGRTRVKARQNKNTGEMEWYDWDASRYMPVETFGQPYYRTSVTVQTPDLEGAGSATTPSDVSKQRIGLAETEAATRSLIEESNWLATQVINNPEIIGAPGSLAQAVDSFTSQSRELLKLAVDWDLDSDLDELSESKVEQLWENAREGGLIGTAVKSAALRSSITDLAYVYAIAMNGTRPTDTDIVNALKVIGGSTGSSAQFVGAIARFQETAMRRLVSRVNVYNQNVLNGASYTLDMDTMPKPGQWGTNTPDVNSSERTEEQQGYIEKYGLQP